MMGVKIPTRIPTKIPIQLAGDIDMLLLLPREYDCAQYGNEDED